MAHVVERRGEVNRGLDDGLSKAFELALTPTIVGIVGWIVDGRLGVTPLFTLLFFFLGIAGVSLSVWSRYDAAMAVHEQAAAAARASRPARRRMTEPAPPPPELAS
ncbi:MAG: hypothetical protein WD232_08175 [Acidimicrobiales bacterium]